MAFHEVRFPANLSFGSVGGPERRTDVVTLANGFEERNTPWANARRRYDAGVGLRSLDDIADLIAFFEARQGQLFGFRWKDWADFKSCQPSGVVEVTVHTAEEGDVFGWSAVVEPHTYTASARCIEKTEDICIKGSDLTSLFEQNPRMGYIVMRNLSSAVSSRLTDTRQKLTTLMAPAKSGE